MSVRRDWGALPVALTGCLFAIGLGLIVGRGGAAVPFGLIVAGLILYVGLQRGKLPLALLTIAALVPLPLSSLGPIPAVKLVEAVVPLFVAALLLRRALGIADLPLVQASPAARALNAAVVVYATVLALNFLRSKFLIADAVHVYRPYWAYAVALGTYLLVYRALTRWVSFAAFLRILFWVAVAMSIFGLVVVALNLPLNLGDQQFSVTTYVGTSAIRVGFLDIFGTIGMALVVTGHARYPWLSAPLFAAALVASGGRSVTIGIIVAAAAYLLIRGRFVPLLVTLALAGVVVGFALPTLQKQSQFQRLTDVNGQAFSSNERSFVYNASLRDFKAHPLIGTGLLAPATVFNADPQVVEFDEQQLEFGGHATYHSLLKNFGLVGFLPFAAALLLALWHVGRLARTDSTAGFFFVSLVSQAIYLYAGGNGSDPWYFLILGGTAALLAARARAVAPAAQPAAGVRSARPRRDRPLALPSPS